MAQTPEKRLEKDSDKGPEKRPEKRLMWGLVQPYKVAVILGLISLLLVDCLEILPAILLKRGIDLAEKGGSAVQIEIVWVSIVYLVVTLLQGVCRYAWRMWLVRSSMLAGRDLRNRLIRKLFRMMPQFYQRNGVGNLMSLANADIDTVRMALGPGLLTFADAVFYLLTVPVAMFFLSPQLTLLALLPLPFIPWIVSRLETKIHQRFEKTQEVFSRISSLTQESLGGVRVLKSFAREAEVIRKFERQGEEYIEWNRRLALTQMFLGPFLDFTMSLGMVALLYFGGKYVINGTVTLGTWVAFQRYLQLMIWPMTALGLAVSYYQRALASGSRLLEVLETPGDPREDSADFLSDSVAFESRKGQPLAIEVRNLNFSYDGKPVLTDLSFKIPAGKRVALMGPIGSGKSTLIQILSGGLIPPAGTVLLEGLDCARLSPSAIRSRVIVSQQDVFLMSDQVDRNINYSENGAGAGQIQPHAHLSGIDHEIMTLPEGYQTLLGERGVQLSGGQKQRISIARALQAQPDLLCLDDSFSAIDTETESVVLARLFQRQTHATEIIIAHRVSSVQSCDWILMLKEGRLIEAGTHAELMRNGKLYQSFYRAQILSDEMNRTEAPV